MSIFDIDKTITCYLYNYMICLPYRDSNPSRDTILKRQYLCVQLVSQPLPMDPPQRIPQKETRLGQVCEIWHPDSAV